MSKIDAKTRIIRYLTKSDITLTAEEETILARWEHIDLLHRQALSYTDILLKHTLKFNVSKFTTNNDITAAQEVFARSRKLNKRYLAHLHIEQLQDDLKRIREGFFKIDAETGKYETLSHKDVAALARIHEAYTYQINSLPEDQQTPDVPKPVIQYNLVGVNNQPLLMDINTAMELADKFINGLPLAEQIPDDDDTE